MVNPMSSAKPRFMEAFPYQASVLALPVTNIDAVAHWYSRCFGMVEVERARTSAKAGSSGCSLSSHPMASATTFTSRLLRVG